MKEGTAFIGLIIIAACATAAAVAGRLMIMLDPELSEAAHVAALAQGVATVAWLSVVALVCRDGIIRAITREERRCEAMAIAAAIDESDNVCPIESHHRA